MHAHRVLPEDERRDRRAGEEQGAGGGVANGRGNRVEDVAIDDELRRVVDHVHGRRLAGDGDRLLERAHLQFAIHLGGELALQDDPFAPDGLEPGQGEDDVVRPRREIDDAILARAVGHRRAALLDQRVARRFDGDARQEGAARVSHESGDAALCTSGQRDQHEKRDDQSA